MRRVCYGLSLRWSFDWVRLAIIRVEIPFRGCHFRRVRFACMQRSIDAHTGECLHVARMVSTKHVAMSSSGPGSSKAALRIACGLGLWGSVEDATASMARAKCRPSHLRTKSPPAGSLIYLSTCPPGQCFWWSSSSGLLPCYKIRTGSIEIPCFLIALRRVRMLVSLKCVWVSRLTSSWTGFKIQSRRLLSSRGSQEIQSSLEQPWAWQLSIHDPRRPPASAITDAGPTSQEFRE